MSSKWQPIETAPKDGSLILITDGHCSYAAWYEGQCQYEWAIADDNGDDNAIGEMYVTHWMPLPEPPTDKGSE